jgi:hypothetical protein
MAGVWSIKKKKPAQQCTGFSLYGARLSARFYDAMLRP